MKHISTKLILLTIILTTTLLAATAYFSFSILKKESRAYTFQSQLLQTQLFAESLQTKLSEMRGIAADLVEVKIAPETMDEQIKSFYDGSVKNHPELQGVGIQLRLGAQVWHETPIDALKVLGTGPDVNQIVLKQVSEGKSDTIALFPTQNAVIAVRLNLEKVFQNCSGLQIALFNSEQKLVYSCDPTQKQLFSQAGTVLKEIGTSRLKAGTLERPFIDQTYLWAYSSVERFGTVISASNAKSAYGPAYSLVSQVLLLILMAIGIAIVASIWMARRLTRPIEEVTRATEKISAGDFDTKINITTRDETSTLARAIESMAVKIKTLLVAEIEKTKLDAQLEVAGAVQRTLIPPKEVSTADFHISSAYHPADQCGGDWWGYVKGSRKVAVLIGDVSGHGYPSAFLVATTRGFLSMIEERVQSEGEIKMTSVDLLTSLNRVVYDATRSELNMTAMCAIIDLDTGDFELSSAGHNPAYQTKLSGGIETLRSKGNRLGEKHELETLPDSLKGRLEKGDKLIFFTDGVQDIGPAEEPIGNKGFKKFISETGFSSAEETTLSFETEIYSLHQGRPLLDDVTFVVFESRA